MARVRLRRWPWLLVALASTLVGVCITGYVGLWAITVAQNNDLSRAQIEQLIGAELPRSTSNIRSATRSDEYFYALARFDIAAADAPPFIASIPLDGTWHTTDNPFDPSDETPHAWWQPGFADRFQWAHRGGQTIFIDMSNPERYTVYVDGHIP